MIFGILNLCAQAIKSACESTINTNNTNQNIATETYPEPHRDPKTGKIIIENYKLYNDDVKNYGASQAQKWVKQGKYNLTPEELEEQHKEFEKKWEHLYSIGNREEERKKINEEKLQWKREERQRREDSLIRHKNELEKKQKIISERQSLNDDCRKTLLEVGYDSVSLQYVEASCTNNYSKWIVSTKKTDEDYLACFISVKTQGLTYNKSHTLVKMLANILATVDIANVNERNANIKDFLNNNGLRLCYPHQEFEIINDYLTIPIFFDDDEVILKFYTSKSSNVKLDFDSMEGHQFEYFCANVLKGNNFKDICVTQGSGDQGIDIIAYKDGIKYGIQCKCYSSDIGNKAVQEVFAGKTFYECHIGIVLTNRYFTKSAIDLAKKNGIVLWDRKMLLKLIENAEKGLE